ncbi:FkbM family methyltransferase [Jiella marina]|uniref:FkbM family methyltransferase n=1 Tax=Jiella sp. LLJ827 TaxID=2917712 RepID=UPI002100768D|nr:FkbM family methyltransferase [Jiella sp. LLJ827]MCQ0987336.1 FkbM family methyltransferase [Jiella sp. LLJ827]
MSVFETEFHKFAARFGYTRQAELFNPFYLQGLQLGPNSIIDVGVRQGTKPLYHAYPELDFLLIDPQAGGEDVLRLKPEKYKFINKAIGRAPGRMEISDDDAKSTLLKRTSLTGGADAKTYTVDVTTLDAVIDEYKPKPKIGIKLDIEGFEMDAIEGLDKHLPDVAFIIAEVSVRERFEGGYTFSQMITRMQEKGFWFYNIMNYLQRRPLFYDVLFLPAGHPLFK